jgi:hypothetical protein
LNSVAIGETSCTMWSCTSVTELATIAKLKSARKTSIIINYKLTSVPQCDD